jgi:hypothetical protein
VKARSGTARVEMSVQEVFLFAKDTAQRQIQNQEDIRNEMSRTNTEIESLKTRLTLNVPGTDGLALQQKLAASNPSIPRLAESNSDQGDGIDHVKAFHHNGSILFDSAQMTAVAAVGIRTVQFPRTTCTPWCSCSCHRETRLRTPRMLEQFIGSLFIGYSGLPVL